MKYLFPVLASFFLAQSALAYDLSGRYNCDNGTTLELNEWDYRSYTATMRLSDNLTSPLSHLVFHGEGDVIGTMYRDDIQDGDMGSVEVMGLGRSLKLTFADSSVVTCDIHFE